jgi:hypothetical protein
MPWWWKAQTITVHSWYRVYATRDLSVSLKVVDNVLGGSHYEAWYHTEGGWEDKYGASPNRHRRKILNRVKKEIGDGG